MPNSEEPRIYDNRKPPQPKFKNIDWRVQQRRVQRPWSPTEHLHEAHFTIVCRQRAGIQIEKFSAMLLLQ